MKWHSHRHCTEFFIFSLLHFIYSCLVYSSDYTEGVKRIVEKLPSTRALTLCQRNFTCNENTAKKRLISFLLDSALAPFTRILEFLLSSLEEFTQFFSALPRALWSSFIYVDTCTNPRHWALNMYTLQGAKRRGKIIIPRHTRSRWNLSRISKSTDYVFTNVSYPYRIHAKGFWHSRVA